MSLTFSPRHVWFCPRSRGYPASESWSTRQCQMTASSHGINLKLYLSFIWPLPQGLGPFTPAHFEVEDNLKVLWLDYRCFMLQNMTNSGSISPLLGVFAIVILISSKNFPCTRFLLPAWSVPQFQFYLSVTSPFITPLPDTSNSHHHLSLVHLWNLFYFPSQGEPFIPPWIILLLGFSVSAAYSIIIFYFTVNIHF